MKIRIDADALRSALELPARVARPNRRAGRSKHHHTITEYVRLVAQRASLLIEATDWETSVTTLAGCEVLQGGELLLLAKLLSRTLAKMSGQLELASALNEEQIETGDAHLTRLERGSRQALIVGADPEQWVEETVPPLDEHVALDAVALRQLIERTAHAAGEDESRPGLCGVRLELTTDALTAVATNSHQMAVSRTEEISTWGEPSDALHGGVTVPTRCARDILTRLPDGRVMLGRTDTSLVVDAQGVRVSAQLVNATYPDWRKVQPVAEPERAVLLRSPELLGHLRRLRLFAPSSGLIRLHLEPGCLTMRAKNQDVGVMTRRMDIDADVMPDDISINLRLLEESLNANPSDEAHLSLQGMAKPVYLFDPEPAASKQLIMPMRD